MQHGSNTCRRSMTDAQSNSWDSCKMRSLRNNT
jgi:hypothetical protein